VLYKIFSDKGIYLKKAIKKIEDYGIVGLRLIFIAEK